MVYWLGWFGVPFLETSISESPQQLSCTPDTLIPSHVNRFDPPRQHRQKGCETFNLQGVGWESVPSLRGYIHKICGCHPECSDALFRKRTLNSDWQTWSLLILWLKRIQRSTMMLNPVWALLTGNLQNRTAKIVMSTIRDCLAAPRAKSDCMHIDICNLQ